MTLRKVKSLTIDRARWANFFSPHDTMMRVTKTDSQSGVYGDCKEAMCCLGFLAKAMGVKPKDLINRANPADVSYGIGGTIPGLSETLPLSDGSKHYELTAFSRQAIKINDSGYNYHSADELESDLKKHFAENGIKLRFKGEYIK